MRLTGRKLIPRRRWIPDAREEVIINGACPPSPVADEEPSTSPSALQFDRAAERRRRARQLTLLYALGGAAIGVAPIPSPDMPILASLEARLVTDIVRLYDPLTASRAAAAAAPLLGLGGFLLRGLARRGQRRVPWLGWVVNGAVAYGGVRLAGELALQWCERRQRE